MQKVEVNHIGLCGWIFLIFLTLKLTGYINWSWWWVTAPLWGGFFLAVALILVLIFVYMLIQLWE